MKANMHAGQPIGRMGTSDECAHLIAFLSKIPFIVGANVSIDGGYVAQ